MKIEVETLSPVERRVTIEVPWSAVKEELDQAYKGLAKRARVKGFRAGHVPRKVLEQMYKGAVEGEVVQRLVDDSFRKAVQDQDLFPINTPVVDSELRFEPEVPFRFSAKVEVKPEIRVEHYKGLEVVRQVRQVEEVEVDREISTLREKATVIEQVTDRNDLHSGDLAVIDFFGYVNGETFKGGKGINYTVEVGQGRMIAGFEDQLVGMKIGEHKEFKLQFPKEEGPEEARGKLVDWHVDLKELKKKVLPDLDDEFAKDLGDYESLAELREKVRENLRTREDARSRRQIREKALEKLVDLNPVDVPPAMIDRQLDYMLSEVKRVADTNKDPSVLEVLAKLREENRDRARKQVAAMLLLEGVGRTEQISATEQDLDARLQEIGRQNHLSAKAVRQQLEREGRLEALRYDIRQDKALEVLVNAAKVTEEVVTGPVQEQAGLGLMEDVAEQGHEHEHEHDHEHDHG